MRPFLQVGEHLLTDPGVFPEIVAPTVCLEHLAAPGRGHTGQVVFFVGEESFELTFGISRQGGTTDRLVETEAPGREVVRSEGLLVEKTAQTDIEQRRQIVVMKLLVAPDIDAELADDLFRYLRVGSRCFDEHGSAVADERAAI